MKYKPRVWKMCDPAKAWAVKWRSSNRLVGETTHLIYDPVGIIKMFRLRREARSYALEKYGYIKTRKDLRTEPHGWRFPEIIRVEVREIMRKVKG